MTATIEYFCDECGKQIDSRAANFTLYGFTSFGMTSIHLCDEHAGRFYGFVKATFPLAFARKP